MTKKGEKTKTATKKKPEQLKIAGTERKTNAKIEAAAQRFVSARDERMDLTKAEKKKHDELLATMKAEGVSHYIFEDSEGNEIHAKINGTEKVIVRRAKDDGEDE